MDKTTEEKIAELEALRREIVATIEHVNRLTEKARRLVGKYLPTDAETD